MRGLKGEFKQLPKKARIEGDDQAFLELQQYADFQNVLSQRLCDDIDRDEPWFQSIDPQLLEESHIDGSAFQSGHIHPALEAPDTHQGLLKPVMITAKMRNHDLEGWERAYPPSLMDCGIDQNTFLHFIDNFNETIKVCRLPL